MQNFAKRITIRGQDARYYDLRGLSDLNNISNNISALPVDTATSRPVAHFYGGNGFTAGNYLPLLSKLANRFALTVLAMQGYWYDKPCAKKITRQQDADALIRFLEHTQDSPVIGIGHSQGATATAIAAARRSDLFSHLYLIEPVTFTRAQALIYDLLPRRLKITREPFKSTLKKPSHWPSIDAYYQHLRGLRAYRRISDEHLQVFAEQSLMPADKDTGFELIFSPAQELANYFGTPFIDQALKTLNKNGTPYTLIIGKPTLFISDKVRANWEKFVPDDRIITLPEFGHLLPIEAPDRCANLIIDDQISREAL